MEQTIVADWIGKTNIGYGACALVTAESQKKITSLLSKLDEELPGTLFCMPAHALHITLCEVIVALHSYSENMDTLLDTYAGRFDKELRSILVGQQPIDIHFQSLEASPNAIIIKGTDDGSFKRIRDEIVRRGLLPPETKLPPTIIHSSIARYEKAVPLDSVQQVVAKYDVDFVERVGTFTTMKGISEPLIEYEVAGEYKLGV